MGTTSHREAPAALRAHTNSKFQQLPFHTGAPQSPRLVWVGKTSNLIPFHPCRGLGHLPQPGVLQTRPGRDAVDGSEAESAWKSLYCRNSRRDNCQHVCPACPCPPGDAWPLSGKEPPALISSELLPRLRDPSLLCNRINERLQPAVPTPACLLPPVNEVIPGSGMFYGRAWDQQEQPLTRSSRGLPRAPAAPAGGWDGMGWGEMGLERSSGNWLWAGSSCSPCPCSGQLSRLRRRDGPRCHTGRGAELGFFGIKEKQRFWGVVSPPSQRCFPARMVPFLKEKLEIFSRSGQSQLE